MLKSKFDNISILISCLILLLMQTRNVESMNVKKENQLWNQTQSPKLIIFSNIEKTITDDDWSSSDESSGFCKPFINCSSDTNRTVLVFIVAIFILCCCCMYQRIQCRQNNDEIRFLTAPNSKWFSQKKKPARREDLCLI